MTIEIEVTGVDYDVPSSAADTNWAAQQVAFEQALATAVNTASTDIDDLETDLAALSAAVEPPAVVGTAGSGTGISAASTSYGRNVVHQVTVGHAALAAAGGVTQTDITLWTLPAKTRVLRVIAQIDQTFTGGSISALVMTCGRAAGGTQYLLSSSVLASTGVRGVMQTELGAGVIGGTGFSSDIIWTTTTTVSARFTATGDDLDTLTTGSVTFYIECCTYP